MANAISSDLTISTAVSVLGNMLAPLNSFTLNINNDIVGRSATVKVPVLDTDDVARAYDSTNGYTASSDTSASVVNVNLNEQIKPFHLNDNDMNKSPLTIQNYARQNANEFGRHLLKLVYTAVESASSTNTQTVDADAVAISNIKTAHSQLDADGAGMDRHLILSATASNNLLPATIETFGANVLESGRFRQLYGMNVHPTNAHGTLSSGSVHSFACSSDAIVIANRMPDVSGNATLEEYTPFTIDGLGLQCAYRRFYDASKGIHYGSFTSIFGVAVAKSNHIAEFAQS